MQANSLIMMTAGGAILFLGGFGVGVIQGISVSLFAFETFGVLLYRGSEFLVVVV